MNANLADSLDRSTTDYGVSGDAMRWAPTVATDPTVDPAVAVDAKAAARVHGDQLAELLLADVGAGSGE